MADMKITATVETSSSEKTDISTVAPPAEQTVTSVAEKITVKKSPAQTPVAPAPEPAPRPSATETRPAKRSYSDTSYKSTTKRQTFREYVDTNRLLSDLSRDYRGTSPAVLENIATHPALYSKQYMPDRYRPSLSAKSRKVIRDAEDLALYTPGLKHMLEVQYRIYGCVFFYLFASLRCDMCSSNCSCNLFCNTLHAQTFMHNNNLVHSFSQEIKASAGKYC